MKKMQISTLPINLIIIIKAKYLTHVHVKIVSQSMSNMCCKAQIFMHRYVSISQICLSPCCSLPSSTQPQSSFVHMIACQEFLLYAVFLTRCVCFGSLLVFINSNRFAAFFHFFWFFSSFVCNYNVSNIIINIHWLSKINLSQKYTHIDFVPFCLFHLIVRSLSYSRCAFNQKLIEYTFSRGISWARQMNSVSLVSCSRQIRILYQR